MDSLTDSENETETLSDTDVLSEPSETMMEALSSTIVSVSFSSTGATVPDSVSFGKATSSVPITVLTGVSVATTVSSA
ncbi:hypothetical protein [Streptococcus cuniculi]|uniref:hypothetical protein n=1 Tax=Streptococcus cuniculi TaxID=1432788 RepID=UPI0024741C0D|nr:hypothetical protein [Streptococcus cuniculi]